MDPYTRPDFASIALITVDTQRDTLDGQPLAVPGTSAMLPRLGRLARAFRRAGRPIVHVVRLYRRDGSDVDLCRRGLVEGGLAVLAPGSPGAERAIGAGTALDGRPAKVGR
jgi:nicotinamidase-related amidase